MKKIFFVVIIFTGIFLIANSVFAGDWCSDACGATCDSGSGPLDLPECPWTYTEACGGHIYWYGTARVWNAPGPTGCSDLYDDCKIGVRRIIRNPLVGCWCITQEVGQCNEGGCSGACTLNKDCGYGCYCHNYSCEQITGCFPDGAQCHSNADCCTNYCDSLGLCACKEPGLFCANNSECCNNICYNNYCCYPDCSCAANTCIGSTCSDGCGGTCAGTKDCAAPPPAIGYVNIKHPLGILKLRLISFANALSALKGIIKVARFAGDTNAAADLVEPTDPNASPVRVMTPYGIKAWRREP